MGLFWRITWRSLSFRYNISPMRGKPKPEMFQKPCLQYLILIVISVKIFERLKIENHEPLHYMHRMALYKYIDDSAHWYVCSLVSVRTTYDLFFIIIHVITYSSQFLYVFILSYNISCYLPWFEKQIYWYTWYNEMIYRYVWCTKPITWNYSERIAAEFLKNICSVVEVCYIINWRRYMVRRTWFLYDTSMHVLSA